MAARRKAPKETDAFDVKQEESVGIDSIGSAGGIEPVSENDMVEASELEVFMNQKLLIRVLPSQVEGELDIIVPNCNGVNQPIIRDRNQEVKRKYVEVLARTRTTVFDQKTPDLSEPANIQMIPKTNLTYPFTVLKDPDPPGS